VHLGLAVSGGVGENEEAIVRAAVIATVRSGLFPRELAIEPDDMVVLVSNFGSDQLEAVNVSRLN
jgi:hypothetical protein